MRHDTITVLLAMTLCTSAGAQDLRKNESLFDDCRTLQRYKKDTASMSGGDVVSATRCLGYMSGAMEVYNFTTHCDLAGMTIDRLIADYIEFTRSTGALQDRAGVVVAGLLETCYCGKPGFPVAVCPKTTQPRK